MGTINSALSVMAGALDADQEALNVVANNVANANTTGYTEEKPDWQESSPISVGGVLVGDGVTETGATSQRDRVLEERLDQQQQMASASSTRLTACASMTCRPLSPLGLRSTSTICRSSSAVVLS